MSFDKIFDLTAGVYFYFYNKYVVYMVILLFLFGHRIFSSRPQYAILGTGIIGQIASFERRLRGAAPTPLAMPYPSIST